MTFTAIGMIITALAIEADKFALFTQTRLVRNGACRHFVGVLIIILSLVLRLSIC